MPGNNINLAETYKILAISFDLITKEEADALSNNDDTVAWFSPYFDVLNAEIEIPELILNYDMGTFISRGEFFYLLNELI